MNEPLVYQLSCQWHRWVATFGRDKRWKHISAKPTTRWDFFKGPWKTTTSIGHRWKGSNVRSRVVLIARWLIVRLFFIGCVKPFIFMSSWRSRSSFSNMLRYLLRNVRNAVCLKHWAYRLQLWLGWSWQRGSPLTIPNREVKPVSADGTAPVGE